MAQPKFFPSIQCTRHHIVSTHLVNQLDVTQSHNIHPPLLLWHDPLLTLETLKTHCSYRQWSYANFSGVATTWGNAPPQTFPSHALATFVWPPKVSCFWRPPPHLPTWELHQLQYLRWLCAPHKVYPTMEISTSSGGKRKVLCSRNATSNILSHSCKLDHLWRSDKNLVFFLKNRQIANNG